MPLPQSAPEVDLLDAVLLRLRASARDDRLELAGTLARSYLNGLAVNGTRASDVDVAGAIESLLELAMLRRPGRFSVRIFNPTVEHNGWQSDHTVIEIVGDDMPFLVDSVAAALSRRDLGIHQLVHPQMVVVRDEGRLVGLEPPGAASAAESPAGVMESLMHIEIDHQGAAGVLQQIQDTLLDGLGDVQAAVKDWLSMRARAQEIIEDVRAHQPPGAEDEDEDREEALRFLTWVLEDHFTFLGCCDYRLVGKEGRSKLEPVAETALGIVARGEERLRRNKISSKSFLEGPQLLRITKSTRRARVHRPVHMDLIAVKWTDEQGRVVGERRILGLFTSRAYSIPVGKIPLVRLKVAHVLDQTGFLPQGHDHKALRAILEQYPRDELFQIGEQDLARFSWRILSLHLKPRPALLVRYDEAGRYISCMVFVPRDRHNTEQRLRIQSLLEDVFEGEVTAFYIRLSDDPLAQLHFIVRLNGRQRAGHDLAAIEARVAAATRSWSDEIQRILVAELGEEAGLVESRRYRRAFPIAYQERSSIETALSDIRIIDAALRTGRICVRLDRQPGAPDDRLTVRSYERGEPAPLSRYLPVLENLGLEVLTEIPFEVRPDDAVDPVWVRAFEVRASVPVDSAAAGERFQDAFLRVWNGEVDNDRFHRLVLGAELSWREIVLLRAYARYLQQVGRGFSASYTAEALVRHAAITRGLVELFFERLDPARQDQNTPDRIDALRAEIRRHLDAVARVDVDRMLRRFLQLIEKTLRTNYFQSTDAGSPKPYLSIKLDTAEIAELPLPRPRYEVFVYSPRFEAVHLRGAKVARGGIRWSDRREDYRSEILGLVKAQMVKNAVIVPVGAKGGFILKRPPSDEAGLFGEAKACYRLMMRGLLDLTDNYQDGDVVPPPDVVRRDEDDPYLVVAADKGTATFSDLANQVAAEYGFWLGDAFASGGSAGYDHKRMGITARGAWESVKEHGRELGIDVECDVFSAVGVGDMSGDVFGNGMLLSQTMKLLGAFNHRHVFVDPDPDPKVSFAERHRLFALPRSSWDAYDPAKLSPGGAVFDRQSKQIEVSPEVRRRFGLPSARTTPVALMRAILGADIDLLWFGGIGTYIKAGRESNAEVADRANDELRLDAEALKAKVVGEGANLGVTQAGRVVFALQGGHINTDFIDNAGGVDCSDHEVNIKIALAGAVSNGELSLEARDALLGSMTEEVAALVLRDNRQQARALSLVAARSADLVDEHQRLMHHFEGMAKLDRQLEGLPDDATLGDREASGEQGLTRPELAVLLAYAKMALTDGILSSDLPADPWFAGDLMRYFPAAMRDAHADEIAHHRLRRELVATQIANSIINRMGPSFVSRNALSLGRTPADVARAFIIAREIFGLRDLWETIESLDGRVPHAAQIEMSLDAAQLLDRASRWLLRYQPDLDVAASVETFGGPIRSLAKDVEPYLPSRSREHLRRRAKAFAKRGVPKRLADRIAAHAALPAGFDIVRVARAAHGDVEIVARVYFLVGERFAFDRLKRAARRLKVTDRWQRQQLSDAVEEMHVQQARLTHSVVAGSGEKPRLAVAAWTKGHVSRVEHFDRMLDEAEARGKVDTTLLAVMSQALRRLAED